jgi:hypothetical protein
MKVYTTLPKGCDLAEKFDNSTPVQRVLCYGKNAFSSSLVNLLCQTDLTHFYVTECEFVEEIGDIWVVVANKVLKDLINYFEE